MKNQEFANSVKNALGTVFLLAGAFFVCSTMLSIRSVFADPVAPTDATMYFNQSGRTSPRSSRTSPRGDNASRATVARTTTANASRAANSRSTVQSRAVTTRANANRANASRANAVSSRNVVSRQTAATNRANANATRAVRARTATTAAVNNARISLQGNAIRGSKANAAVPAISYLNSKLHTGNYSNIIDSTTGLISSDAFNNCMESYYTCMDEICTARNAAQRRCACAGRVKAFAEAEAALETANEELIKVSGELALLIANKGKDVSEAFQLTDAEKVMNCVSWQDVTNQYGQSSKEAIEWCSNHGIYAENGGSVSSCAKPKYCSTTGNSFGFDVTNLDGNGSDILASLQSWANAKEQTITILDDDNDGLLASFENLSSVVSGLSGINGALDSADDLKDSLAETWGYELFEYAHNNVCARVLDSCFNGIYEACGTPPSGTKCSNGAGQCPYNYNSKITVSNSGTYELNFVKSNSGYSASNSATCFGYASTSGDPYSNLRGPVADARRSIMQKYALDANADCDAYGEQLRTTAQNIGYQKVAAQQALQQKRLEFANEERDTILADAIQAGTNFNNCISEIYECYETQRRAEANWSDTRIKTYCAQVANVPSCYEEMICNPSMAQFKAIIDKADSTTCLNSQDYTKNTCRNVVTLNEILNGTGATPANIASEMTGSSAAMREQCMLDAGVAEIRDWTRVLEDTAADTVRCTVKELYAVDKNARTGIKDGSTCIIQSCNTGYTLSNNQCVANETKDCTESIANAAYAVMTSSNNEWSECKLVKCQENYNMSGNECVAATRPCPAPALTVMYAESGTQTWTGQKWGDCVIETCLSNYELRNNMCEPMTRSCPTPALTVMHAESGIQTWTGQNWGDCVIKKCLSGYELLNNMCEPIE